MARVTRFPGLRPVLDVEAQGYGAMASRMHIMTGMTWHCLKGDTFVQTVNAFIHYGLLDTGPVSMFVQL